MKTTFKIFASLIVLSLALTACGTQVMPQAEAVSAAPISAGSVAADPQTRTIQVTGAGLVNTVPDVAYINIGIHTEDENASTAVSENNRMVQNLMATLKAAGVQEIDMQTSNFSIWQNQKYDYSGVSTGSTYMVDNTVYVTVRDLDSLGDTLDSAVQAGANNINSIQFSVADDSALKTEARGLAVENAKKIAQELASAAGVELGEIISMSYYSTASPMIYYGARGMGGGGGESSVPITTGQISIDTSVDITFSIK